MSQSEPMLRMFVNGQAMSGGSISFALEGAKYLGKINTAKKYQFYSVRDEFPGLRPVTEGGAQVPGELYEVSYRQLREQLLPNEPSELELTLIELEDGSGSLSMKMREGSIGLSGVSDITDCNGWHAYLASK